MSLDVIVNVPMMYTIVQKKAGTHVY